MIDMRKRFRGNKPIATSVELEAGGGEAGATVGGGQLYAGKGGYEGVGARATDGREGVDGRIGAGQGEYEVYVRNDGIEDLRKK